MATNVQGCLQHLGPAAAPAIQSRRRPATLIPQVRPPFLPAAALALLAQRASPCLDAGIAQDGRRANAPARGEVGFPKGGDYPRRGDFVGFWGRLKNPARAMSASGPAPSHESPRVPSPRRFFCNVAVGPTGFKNARAKSASASRPPPVHHPQAPMHP